MAAAAGIWTAKFLADAVANVAAAKETYGMGSVV